MLQFLIILALIVSDAFLLGVSMAFENGDGAFAYLLFTLFWAFVLIRFHSGSDAAASKVSPWK